MTEPEILEFWRTRKIFEKSLEKTKDGKPFVFYEGPPTANAKPALHHLEARAFKDVIPRYQTMRGRYVRRRAGWDTHGLPVELQVEKKLGLQSKKDIEKYGIAEFNKECRDSVFTYIKDWEEFTDRIGYWVTKGDAYYTFDASYIESLWSILGHVNKRDLLYKDYKVVPWCPRCGTGLSSHELAQGYQDVKDLSLYVKFKVKNPENLGYPSDSQIFLLAWTTTPWTLPGNVALAVGDNIEYQISKIKVQRGGFSKISNESDRKDTEVTYEYQIFASSREEKLWPQKDKKQVLESGIFTLEGIERKLKGEDLIGLEYKPLYPFLNDKKPDGIEKAFKVYPADFVTTEDGTGIVHTAVMYGADDFALGTEVGLPKHHLVGEDGKFISGTGFLEGRFVNETDENGKPTLAVDIIEDLKKQKLFLKQENVKHSYPHCWRCKTKLIYFARDSWYIRMSALRDDLLQENKSINWEPAHIREGRFGEWLREVKDWAISRERYWGTPLPIWETADESERFLVTSVERLKDKAKKSGNRYFVMRHGEAENNVSNTASSKANDPYHLTEKGKEQAKHAAKELEEGIDSIIASPFLRTRETAELVADAIGFPREKIIYDERLSEVNTGEFSSGSVSAYHSFFKDQLEKFTKTPPGGENLLDLKRRVARVVADLEKRETGKRVLIVSHEYPLWMLSAAAEGATPERATALKVTDDFIVNGGVRELDWQAIPRNGEYELDLHRPYIDDIVLMSDKGHEMRRVKEVMDVWFDSGAMPFAQDHYPFENKRYIEHEGYPADFISEAIDQTRGWFYTLHAIGVLMDRGRAYKNVISLGHILDKEGKKMSKSLGNVIDPWAMIEKYGVDALRFWMYAVNQPGDSKNFDEKTIEEGKRKVFGLLSNVLAFYELYRNPALEANERPQSDDVLDRWILARLAELIDESTRSLDAFKLQEPARAIRDFVDDLSTWYVRRSRDRMKEGDASAKRTLYFVLKTLSKILAPFAPFSAEDIHQRLRRDGDAESVHLETWPAAYDIDRDLLERMRETRSIVEDGLARRAAAGIKVRQPLASFAVPESTPPFFPELVQDELNVKEVVRSGTPGLDTAITPALKKEGQLRELTRSIQELRKDEKLTPSDRVTLSIDTTTRGFIEGFESEIKKATLADTIRFESNDGKRIEVDDMIFTIRITK